MSLIKSGGENDDDETLKLSDLVGNVDAAMGPAEENKEDVADWW